MKKNTSCVVVAYNPDIDVIKNILNETVEKQRNIEATAFDHF